jgi:hypothetical protein
MNPASRLWEVNAWTVIAVLELAVIIVLLALHNRKPVVNNKNAELKKKVMAETVDFDNIVNSAFHSVDLYNQLKVKCHPDRFPDDAEMNAKALEIFQQIAKNKNNLKKLEELKQRAINELNVKF